MLHQGACGLYRVACYRVGALGSVGQPRGVSQIDEALAWESLRERPHHGQPAHAGIENAYRVVAVAHFGGLAK